MDDAGGRLLTVEGADRGGAEQIAESRILPDVRADALPEVVQALLVLVSGLDEAAPQFQALLQNGAHRFGEFEQCAGVEPVPALVVEQLPGDTEAVGAGDLQVFPVPKDQLEVVAVEAVNVTRQPGTLAHRRRRCGRPA
jgi:hypothetical protein